MTFRVDITLLPIIYSLVTAALQGFNEVSAFPVGPGQTTWPSSPTALLGHAWGVGRDESENGEAFWPNNLLSLEWTQTFIL